MTYLSSATTLLVLFLTSVSTTKGGGNYMDLDKDFGIRPFYSILYLGSSIDQVTLQNPDGSDYQLWQLVPSARLGLFNIINKHNGNALDVVGSSSAGYNATFGDLTDSVYQQWYINWDSTITNAGLISYLLDIPDSNYFAGNYVRLVNRYDVAVVNSGMFIFTY